MENIQNDTKSYSASFLNNFKNSKDNLKKTTFDALGSLNKKSKYYFLELVENKINKNTLELVLQDLGLTKDDLLKSFDLIKSNDE